MFTDWQTPVALVVVLIAAAALLRTALSRKKKPGCGGGFCPTDEFKNRLNRKPH